MSKNKTVLFLTIVMFAQYISTSHSAIASTDAIVEYTQGATVTAVQNTQTPIHNEEIQARPVSPSQIESFAQREIGVLVLLALVMMLGFGGGVLYRKKKQKQLTLRIDFVESEITKMFKLITDDVEMLSRSLKTHTTTDNDYALERLTSTIQKMESYLKKAIDKIKG